MNNITNQVLELSNGEKFFVIRQAVYKGTTYFYVGKLTDDAEDFTNEFTFLEKVGDGDLKVRKVADEAIIEVLAKNIKIEQQ